METTTSAQEIMLEPQATAANLTDTCEICRDIWSCFLDPTTFRQVSLGYSDDPLPPRCPRHSPLFIYWRDNSTVDLPEGVDLPDGVDAIDWDYEAESASIGDSRDEENTEAKAEKETHVKWVNEMVVVTQRPGSVLLSRNIAKGSAVSQQVLMLKKDSIPGHLGHGVRLDPDWIDLQLARKWKQKCLDEHGTKCRNPLKVSPVRPFWVVDVESECIIPGRDCAAFVALSYRWGNHSWPAVDRQMLTKLRKPGALSTAHVAPIVRHAMHLTLALGERFLWVDALCVIKDDDAETVHQLNLMGAFYASAVLTIVVADGDSLTGIQGLKGVSSPRKAKQVLIPFGDEMLLCPDFEVHLGDYKTRGWTYQEYIMAQRRLIFAGNRMHWVCQSCNWHEEVVVGCEPLQAILYQQPDPSIILRGSPDINSLRHLMSDYNSRSFSYGEDVIPGISGLLSLFSRSFQGGFLCGLPEMFFDKALGWCASRDLRRREPSGRQGKDQLPNSLGKLPSWSWVGWEGRISDDILEPAEAIQEGDWFSYNHGVVEETTPITNWFTSHSADGTALRRITSTWFEDREARYKDFTRPLPEGWTRQEVERKPRAVSSGHWRPPGCSDSGFRHRLFPESHWYFPFPLSEVRETTTRSMPEQTPYLFCKTHKAELWAVCSVQLWEQIDKKTYWSFQGLAVAKNIRILEIRAERDGPKVGELYLHNTSQLAPFFLASDDCIKIGPGQPVELVAIYRSLVRETFDHGPDVISERYRVLWVVWKDGIAYRSGVGWVERESWEGVNRTEIDLVLG